MTLDTLEWIVVLGEWGESGGNPVMAPAGEPFTVIADVTWKNNQGQRVAWSNTRIHVRYGNDVTDKHDGRGPHTFRPRFVKRTVVVTVDLWNEPDRRWKAHTIFKQDVQAYCAVDMSGLSEEEQHVVATLFSEGGSTPEFTRDELIRVAWAMRNRVDLIKVLEEAAAATPDDRTIKRRLDKVHKYFGKHATYTDVLTRAQFSGVGDPRYLRAKEPASKVVNPDECSRLQLTWDVALEAMLGITPDPYAGQGNSTAPGVYYYMTKAKYDENVKLNRENGTKKFAPEWDKLPGQAGDYHWYWGMKPEDPFEP